MITNVKYSQFLLLCSFYIFLPELSRNLWFPVRYILFQACALRSVREFSQKSALYDHNALTHSSRFDSLGWAPFNFAKKSMHCLHDVGEFCDLQNRWAGSIEVKKALHTHRLWMSSRASREYDVKTVWYNNNIHNIFHGSLSLAQDSPLKLKKCSFSA